MSEPPGKAVFLSYASQDSDAARRIAQALRAEGIEVWFDESALAGGEAWDASIRRQIRDCALFVAIVSANTQARKEGYFRLEWRLADERSQLIAEGTPFVLPAIVDGTKERDALVPKSFLGVQWTWLPHGEVPPAFVTRVQRLLGIGRAAVDVSTSAEVASAFRRTSAPTHTIEPAIHDYRRLRSPVRWTVLLPWAVSIGLAVCLVWPSRRPKHADTFEPRYYELALPESAPVAFTGRSPNGLWQRAVAVSRDGRTVAYVTLKGDTTSLVARFLDTGGTRDYPGTEGAYLPFFSPDGQWIAYFVMEELKKVAIGGGTPSTLATDIHVAAGATWVTPDRILVARSEGGRPMWVSLSSRDITPIEGPAYPANIQSRVPDLDILPGNEWAIGSNGFLQLLSLKGTGVYWVSKNGPVRAENAKIADVLPGWSPRYLKEGYVIFMSGQGTELQAMRFNPATLRPTGAPFTVLEGIRREEYYANGQFTIGEQGTLVFASGAAAEECELAWIDEQGQREKVAIPSGLLHSLNLSRDGLIAFFRKKPIGRYGDLIVADVATGRQVRTFAYEGALARALWGPDSSLYLTPWDMFQGPSKRATQHFPSVVSSDFTDQPADYGGPTAISPDGNWMAFTNPGGKRVLRSLRDSNAPAVPVSPSGWCASFSPDSRWLATTGFGPINKTVVIPVPPNGQVFEVASDEGTQPRWFPDGRRLAYRRGRAIMVIDLTIEGNQVSASRPRVFAEGPFPRTSGWSYDIGPDGRVLTFVNAEETSTRRLNIITNFPELVRQKERQTVR